MMRSIGLLSIFSGLVAAISMSSLPGLTPQGSDDLQAEAPSGQPNAEIQGDTSPSTPDSIFGWQNIPPIKPPPTPLPEENLPTLDAHTLPPTFDVT